MNAIEKMDQCLTAEEELDLAKQEEIIERGLKSAFETGAALRYIRNKELYRKEHRSIEEYAERRWNMSRQYFYQLIKAADVRDTLSKQFQILPTNEFQARPLAVLSTEQQLRAWDQIVKHANGRITNKVVQAVVDDFVEAAELAKRSASVHPTLDKSINESYICGDPVEQLKALSPKTFDLLLALGLTGATPAATAQRLGQLLEAASPAMKDDHQILVGTEHHDSRTLISIAESLGYETGVSFVRLTDTPRTPVDWSARRVEQSILHFRRGNASLAEAIPNVIQCDDETFKRHASQQPLGLVRALIDAATHVGDAVLDISSGAATANVACRQLGRSCIGIESDVDAYSAGIERLAQSTTTSNER